MEKITYLDHSGFAVVTPSAILVFDYYRDPAHALKKVLHEYPSLPVIFLVSHHHEDHFNRDIFDLAQDHKRTYVLSNDIVSKVTHDDIAIAWMSAGDTVENLPGDITVKAYGSTDIGVSYLVTLPDGKTIFHAGDLNYWHWQQESTADEVRAAYNRFVKVMTRLLQDVKSLDMAFFPVDPRMGQDFSQGARLFLSNIDVKYFFPMHFWGDYREACDFENYVPDNTESLCLFVPGESVELIADKAIRVKA